MKKYEGKEVEIIVEPFSERKTHYVIYYREKKKFNLFNRWKRYDYTWTLSVEFFDQHQPHLFEKFEHAVESAKRLKKNPKLIDENEERRIKKYKECTNALEKYKRERNKNLKI
jgi:hypothetical protein